MWVFYSLRNYYFHILMNCKIYMLFYESKPTVCWIYLFWMIWVLLNILKLWWCWSMYMICGVRMNCVTVRGGWEFCRLGLHCKWVRFLIWVIKWGHDALRALWHNFGLGNMSLGLGDLSLGLNFLSQGLWGHCICIHISCCICGCCFYDIYISCCMI